MDPEEKCAVLKSLGLVQRGRWCVLWEVGTDRCEQQTGVGWDGRPGLCII